MQVRLCLLLALLAIVFLAACGSKHVKSPTPPQKIVTATPARDAPALLESMRGASFSVLFEGAIQQRKGELLWQQAPGVERWDFAFLTPNGKMDVESAIKIDGKDAGACHWIFEDRTRVDLSCTHTLDFDETLNFAIRLVNLNFRDAREIVGDTAYCFQSSLDRPGFGDICLSDDGIPLSESVQFGLWGPAQIDATELRQLPSLDELRHLPWDVATQGPVPRNASPSQLDMPHLPMLDEYLASS